MSTWMWFALLILGLMMYRLNRKRKKAVAKKHTRYKKRPELRRKEAAIMKELVSRFIEKDVFIKLLEGNVDGVVKEVTDNGIVIENEDGLQIVNLEYVLKVREYPYKNGKRAMFINE